MRQLLSSQGVLVLILFGLLNTSVYGAKVGYYEMCYGEGQAWAVTPITAAGHTPVYLADLSSSDLQGLDVLFVTNCSNVSHGAEYLSRLPEVDAAVQNGLVLMIHDRRVTQAAAILPGGSVIQSVRGAGRDVDVVDDSTKLTHGPGGVINSTNLDGARNSEHGYLELASLPVSGRRILSRPDPGQSVVTTYRHGKGNVIYSSIPLDYYAGILPVCMRFIDPQFTSCQTMVNVYAPNVVAFAVELTEQKPRASAGADQSVDEGALVSLDGSASTGTGDLTYQWQQLSPSSPLLELGGNTAKPVFTAPAVEMNTTFTLQLVVVDSRGKLSDPDTVDITVKDVNTPPVADAGDDFSIKAGAPASLDGSHSYDADGDTPLLYNWNQIAGPAVILSDPTISQPNFVVPNAIGQQLVFELTVSDGKELSLASRVTVTIVENAPPLADAGVDQTRDEGNIISLNALGSADPDKDGLLFDWVQIDGPPVELDNPGSPTPFFIAPHVAAGGSVLSFAVTVTDTDILNPKSSVDQVVIHLQNINDPPACHLARPSVASLWPPNHKMRPVAIEAVSDTDSIHKDVVIVINSISMDEPLVGHGSGHSSPDAVIQDMTPNDAALLRAERKHHGNGRVYQVNFTASDGFESCSGHVLVMVPKSRKHYKDCDDKDDDDDKKDHKSGHKHDSIKHKHGHKHDGLCQGTPDPELIDDGQNYDATLKHKHDHHGIKERVRDKLKKLKQKRHEYKKNKKHNKKSRKSDD